MGLKDWDDRWRVPKRCIISIMALVLIIMGMVYYNTYVAGNARTLPTPPTQSTVIYPTTVTSSFDKSMTTANTLLNQILISPNTPTNLIDVPRFCDALTGCVYHCHIHIDIFVHSSAHVAIPDELGHINNQQYDLFALHPHDYSGIIHIECCTPYENKTFTLREIFELWDIRHLMRAIA